MGSHCPGGNYPGGTVVRGKLSGGRYPRGGGEVIILFPIKYVKGYDIETNDLNSDRSPENIAKSITDVASIQKMIDMMQAYQILLLTTQVNENLENCV